jgi:hypothetical protein
MSAALILVLAAAVPQDSGEKLKKFERTFARDDKESRKGSSDDRKEKRQETPSSGGGRQDFTVESSGSREYSLADFFFYPAIDHGLRFQDYPYAESERYFSADPLADKTLAVRLATTAARIERDLWSLDFDGALSWSSGCEFRFNVTQLAEKVDDGVDRLTLQQYHLSFGGCAGPRNIDFSIGFGVSALKGEEVSDSGPSFQGAMTWYPLEPFSLRVSAGFVKFSEASLIDFRAEAAFHVGRLAVTGGVRSLISTGGEDLTGPTLGLAVFF